MGIDWCVIYVGTLIWLKFWYLLKLLLLGRKNWRVFYDLHRHIIFPCNDTEVFMIILQVGTSESCIMSSCIKPVIQGDKEPVVLLHCFDRFSYANSLLLACFTSMIGGSYLFSLLYELSSCLEWRRTYPLLEDTGVEAWAIDILGWGFSDLGFVFLPYFCFQLKYSAYFCVHVFLLFVFLLYVILLSPLQKDVQPVMLHRKDTIFTRFCSI